MKNTVKLLLLGLMTWAIPFFAAFVFMDQTGQLSIDKYLFKTIMIIVGGLVGAFAIVIYFKKQQNAHLKHGVLSGITWFIINVALDLVLLVPMSKMLYPDYFNQIGLRYLMIPVMTILVGYILKVKYNDLKIS
jgi:uncharacterized membrane protein YpjA